MTTLCVLDRDGGLPRGIASITSDDEFDNNIVNPVFICSVYEKPEKSYKNYKIQMPKKYKIEKTK